jgi:hypothetical protein
LCHVKCHRSVEKEAMKIPPPMRKLPMTDVTRAPSRCTTYVVGRANEKVALPGAFWRAHDNLFRRRLPPCRLRNNVQ